MDAPFPPVAEDEARAAASAVAVERLAALLADVRPDAVVTTQVWCMEHLLQVPRGAWRTIGQFHSSFEAAAMPGGPLPRLLAAYRDADIVTALSTADTAAFQAEGLRQTVTLPNPLTMWPDAVADAGAHDGQILVLGRLSVEKAPLLAIEAWSRIAERHPGWVLRFVGSGPQEDEVRARLLDEPGLPVQLDGPVADPRRVLGEASVLLLPSLVEGQPLALMEAMAAGMACVASDCSGGVRDLVDDGVTARLAVRGSASDLARCLDELLVDADARRRMGDAARERMRAYRTDAILDRWEELLG
jgi:glycosyltransferase involved in cell wall biosynthesis